jgi:hypothetical protein
MNKKVSAKTAKRYVKSEGLNIVTPRKVPNISLKNKKIRLYWQKGLY